MMDLALRDPPEVIYAAPAFGVVGGHTILVKWGETSPPTKPTLVQTQIERLRDAYVRVGEVVAALDDATVYQFGPVTMTGAELKGAYFALHTIEVTDDTYAAGYGGENHGDILYIGLKTVNGYGLHRQGGYNFLMLHEMSHNSRQGRAVVQQNFDRHLAAGGTSSGYKRGSVHFETQEQMTNSLTKQIADQIGVNIESTDPNSPGYPTYGYYSGTELDPE